MKKAGLLVIALGFLLTIFTAFRFFTKEKVLDVGPVEVTREEPHTVAWSPLIGIGIMIIGGVIVWQGNKN